MKNRHVTSILISITCCVLIGIHIVYPMLTIDSITFTLIVVGILPWFMHLLKSVKLPGGMEIELQDFKELEERADKAGMIEKSQQNKIDNKYTFQTIAKEDPKLALAGLRIELEDKLRKIANQNKLLIHALGVRQLIQLLSSHNLLTRDEENILLDMTGSLNAAVHSDVDRFNYTDVNWALDVGTKVLRSLDKRIELNNEV